ncbi:MAG: nucleoside triphosphate pyrophosphohydrolase [Treponema sp.]|nr:nucleoside triphosphate pyrophosphohydrolase [Treponema sp.]
MDFDVYAFKGLYDIVARLRAPDGCPWDREQTPQTLRGALIEETYECVEAIDEQDPAHIKEELGDIFLLATMIAYMQEEAGFFSVSQVLEGIGEKLVRRHPHVFGNQTVKDSAEVLENWAKIKVEQEGRKPKDSILDEVSQSLPPLDRAYKLQSKAAKTGFDWTSVDEVFDKVQEELEEVRTAPQEALEGELGDLLFSVVNLCRFLHIEPSVALQRTNAKFTSRFKYVEKNIHETGLSTTSEKLALMNRFWEEAKSISP